MITGHSCCLAHMQLIHVIAVIECSFFIELCDKFLAVFHTRKKEKLVNIFFAVLVPLARYSGINVPLVPFCSCVVFPRSNVMIWIVSREISPLSLTQIHSPKGVLGYPSTWLLFLSWLFRAFLHAQKISVLLWILWHNQLAKETWCAGVLPGCFHGPINPISCSRSSFSALLSLLSAGAISLDEVSPPVRSRLKVSLFNDSSSKSEEAQKHFPSLQALLEKLGERHQWAHLYATLAADWLVNRTVTARQKHKVSLHWR